MHTQTTLLFKPLLAFSLVAGLLSPAYACLPAAGEKPASIAEKAQDSLYVFEGVVTEITGTYIKIKVEQYFKGTGLNELKIAQHQELQNSCTDPFVLNQRALFFTKGDMQEPLEAVYDGAFGSVREMNADNFSEITAATACMATYANGKLIAPCIAHKDTPNFYQATLEPVSSTTGLKFSIADVDDMNPDNFNETGATECMAIYDNAGLTVPCIAIKESQKVYRATLEPVSTTDSLMFSVAYAAAVSKIQHIVHFDEGKLGELPDNWKMGLTGEGGSRWKLEEDSTAPSSPLVLKQSADGDFPWCIKQDSNLTDGFVAVKFKAISGSIDQAAGLIWRWKDANNYYVARANALEDNVSIYYMKDGQRYTIRYEDVPGDLPVKKNVWQTLRVDFQGDHFMVSFAGKVIVDVTDSHIKGAGAVGLWTKQDSVTSFDDFSYGEQ